MYLNFSTRFLEVKTLKRVVAGLPELFRSDLFRDGEFEGLKGFGEGFFFGLAEEERYGFGHEDVAVDVHLVALSGGLEGVFEEGVVRGEGGSAVIAAEGDEVEMSLFLISFDHPTSGNSRGPRKTAGGHVGSVMDFRCREDGAPGVVAPFRPGPPATRYCGFVET